MILITYFNYFVALIMITTRILHTTDGFFHWYLDMDYIEKTFTDRIMNDTCSSENLSSMIFILLVFLSMV
jgi:hypothetical protein